MNILITGTSSGIGYGLAKYYLDKGYTVYGISRRDNNILNEYAKFHYLQLDLTHFNLIETELPRFLTSINTLDLVVLNAGIVSQINDMKDTGLEHCKDVMDSNVWANKVLLDVLIGSEMRINQIVGISSGASVNGNRGWNAYALSKTTLNMLMMLYANELPYTHVSAFAPGVIDTAMQNYIYDLPVDERFPILDRLQTMKRNKQMPSEIDAAVELAKGFEKVLKLKTGGYYDIREI